MLQLHIKDKQGVKYTNEDFKFLISTKNVPDMPTQTLVQDQIPYSRKKITYRRVDENRVIRLKIFFDAEDGVELTENVNKLNSILANEVELRFEELGYVYFCNLINEISQEAILQHYKYYDLEFETTTPYKYSPQASNETIEFGEGWSFGMGAEFSDPTVYIIKGNTTVTLTNFGNESALPVFVLSGTCSSIAIGDLSYVAAISTNLVIDCENKLCYEVSGDNLINKLSNLSGKFIEIPKGASNLTISGTDLNLTLEVIYRHTYR